MSPPPHWWSGESKPNCSPWSPTDTAVVSGRHSKPKTAPGVCCHHGWAPSGSWCSPWASPKWLPLCANAAASLWAAPGVCHSWIFCGSQHVPPPQLSPEQLLASTNASWEGGAVALDMSCCCGWAWNVSWHLPLQIESVLSVHTDNDF